MKLAGSVDGVRRSRTAKTLVKVVGVVAIAAFFSAFYCWGFWDVMGAMKRVPVGIVNLDEGACIGDKTMNLGADIVEAAQESEDATFVSLDKDAMSDGIEGSGYLIVFEIPSDFSQRVASSQSGLPSVADLTILKNEHYNFIYSQFASRITSALETNIYQQIAKAYTVGAYEGLFSARDGLFDAAASMQEVEEGASNLADGLAFAAVGAQTATEGASSLASGSAALVLGIGSAEDALDTASSGASRLKSASSRLNSGLSSLPPGLSDGSAQLSGAQGGLETLSATLDSAGDAAGALASGAAGAKQCYQAAQAALVGGGSYGGLAADEWMARGDAALDRVAGGASELAAGLSGTSDSAELAAAYSIGVADTYGPSPLVYGVTAFAISFCFMLMMQCLNMVFGLIGKALAVVILILQLACSGGTLPTVLGQGFLATMQPWLPFTYAVDVLREVITYCNVGTVLSDLVVLLGMGLVCLVCSLLLWPIAEKRRDVEAAEYSAYHIGTSESALMDCSELS